MPRALEIPIEVSGLDRAVGRLERLAQAVRNVPALNAGTGGGLPVLAGAGGAPLSGAGAARVRPPRTFEQRFTTFVRSTRFGAGGGAMPLVGRTADLLGMPAAGMAALGGVTAALVGFGAAVKAAAEHLNDFGEAMRLTGGTAGDVAGMARFGFRGAAGAAAAGAFRERISTDPMAQMFAARLGIRALPRPFGQVNEAATLNKAAEALAKMTDAEERLRTARELGLESALKYIDISPQLRHAIDQQAAFEENMLGGAKAANELAVSTELLQNSWQDLMAVIATPVFKDLAYGFEKFAALFHGDFAEAFSDDTQANTQAIEDNTQAHKDTQQALKFFLPPGQYGGGPLSNGAMPAGWSGDFLARQMETGALSKGLPGV